MQIMQLGIVAPLHKLLAPNKHHSVSWDSNKRFDFDNVAISLNEASMEATHGF